LFTHSSTGAGAFTASWFTISSRKPDSLPREFVFTVSATMLRDIGGYDRVLETFSRPLSPFIEYNMNDQQGDYRLE
jgi:hypothetical protein